MKKYILTILSIFALVSCDGNLNPDNGEDSNNQSNPIIGKVSGVAQKGQLAKGSQVTAFALDENLIATGESFPANISDDLGSFSVRGKTTAPYLELRAEGYYFNEVSGSITDAPIYLEAVVPSSETDANLNLFTTLTKGRIKTIIASGKNYDDAKKQAQEELAKALGLSINGIDFEDLDITKNSDSNALLLYVACMIQNDRAISGITTAIQSVATEFEKAGTLSTANVEKLLQPSSQLDVPKIISNLQAFYTANNNATAQIPPFWKYAGGNGNHHSFLLKMGLLLSVHHILKEWNLLMRYPFHTRYLLRKISKLNLIGPGLHSQRMIQKLHYIQFQV